MEKTDTNHIAAKITALLKDFTQEKEPVSGIFNDFHKFSIDEGDYDEKRLIRYLFKKYLHFTIWDKPFEKVNWEIPFTYKGVPASVTHQKFGFRIYVSNKKDKEEAAKLFQEILHNIDLSLRVAKKDVREIGIASLKKGEVIVENKFRHIENEFTYFLKETKRKQKKSNMPTTLSFPSVGKINFKLYEQAEYIADATYIAFFSLIEHLCILGLAFTTSSEKYNLESFSKKTWQDKFKHVFPLTDPEFNDCYNKLVNLAKYRRNPVAHGYLDKTYAIFHFYLPEAEHRIPMGLYDRELLFKLKHHENLSVLEDFLRLVRTNKQTKKIMWYLEMGFDISYAKDSFKEYEKYMHTSDREAKEYLKYQAHLEDNFANMDW